MAEQKNPKALLEDAIKRRDELNTFIKILQEMIGASADEKGETPSTDSRPERRIAGDPSDPLAVVYPGMFFSKSQTQATKLFLEQFDKRPQKMKVILEALAKGGKPVGGKNPTVNLWSILDRAKDTFVLVPKAGWGLVEWYGEAAVEKWRREGKGSGAESEENGNDA